MGGGRSRPRCSPRGRPAVDVADDQPRAVRRARSRLRHRRGGPGDGVGARRVGRGRARRRRDRGGRARPREGTRRRGRAAAHRPSRGVSIALAVLALGSLAFGFASATGPAREVAGQTALWAHIALALLMVLPLAWHVVVTARAAAASRPRRGGPSFGQAARRRRGGLYAGVEGVGRLVGAAGRRAAVHRVARPRPGATPVTSWIDDAVPACRGVAWRLPSPTPADADPVRVPSWSRSGRRRCGRRWTARRAGTSPPTGPACRSPGCSGRRPDHRSIRVRSLTGYDRYFPLSDLDHLLLAIGATGGLRWRRATASRPGSSRPAGAGSGGSSG